MKILYYPGCTLKTKAKILDSTIRAFSSILGVELEELPRWFCCGTNFNLTHDDFMDQIGSVRNLLMAQKEGAKELVAVCSICYNTLKRAEEKFREDEDFRNRINFFMRDDGEEEYEGGIEVIHYLDFLKNRIGFDKVKAKVKKPLKDLKVAAFYGCYLLRPRSLAIDNWERPTIFEEYLEALGATPVDYGEKNECCGSFETISSPEFVANRVYKIVNSARKSGADIITTSCPLCHFNLDRSQKLLVETISGFEPLPILYFTELGYYALTGEIFEGSFEENYIEPHPLLEAKGML